MWVVLSFPSSFLLLETTDFKGLEAAVAIVASLPSQLHTCVKESLPNVGLKIF